MAKLPCHHARISDGKNGPYACTYDDRQKSPLFNAQIGSMRQELLQKWDCINPGTVKQQQQQ